MEITEHAAVRMRQRAISEDAVECLIQCGRKLYDHHGAVVRYFDKVARRQLAVRLGKDRFQKMERELDAYLVMSADGAIVTVGHRDKRLNRH